MEILGKAVGHFIRGSGLIIFAWAIIGFVYLNWDVTEWTDAQRLAMLIPLLYTLGVSTLTKWLKSGEK